MNPLIILSWLSLIRQAVSIGAEVYGVIKGSGGSARVERYRRFNQAMKVRKEKEDAKIGTNSDRSSVGGSIRAF